MTPEAVDSYSRIAVTALTKLALGIHSDRLALIVFLGMAIHTLDQRKRFVPYPLQNYLITLVHYVRHVISPHFVGIGNTLIPLTPGYNRAVAVSENADADKPGNDCE